VALGKTVVYGILGFEGQLAIFNHKEAKIYVICFRNRQVLRMYLIAVLTGLGTLPGMMGTMMAHETLKLIIGLQL
jgi:adenylyltransferase/sulfurtransferase